MSVLNKTVSYFPNKTTTTEGTAVNLLTLLKSDKHKDRILLLRRSENEAEQKQLKEELPCYTVAGVFNRRCDEGLICSSGLAAVDLDSAEDYDAIYLVRELKKLECIAYVGLSCRGKRLFCIVPLKYPEKYINHYERLIKSFSDYGLPMGDDCHKRISQPRFVSWNDNSTQFFNHDAKPYYLLPVEKKYVVVKQNCIAASSPVSDNPFKWCVEQINKSYSFIEGKRHDYIIHLARYCNMKGLPESETLQGCLGYSKCDFAQTEIKNIIKHVYTEQSDSYAKLHFFLTATGKKQHIENSQSKIDPRIQNRNEDKKIQTADVSQNTGDAKRVKPRAKRRGGKQTTL